MGARILLDPIPCGTRCRHSGSVLEVAEQNGVTYLAV